MTVRRSNPSLSPRLEAQRNPSVSHRLSCLLRDLLDPRQLNSHFSVAKLCHRSHPTTCTSPSCSFSAQNHAPSRFDPHLTWSLVTMYLYHANNYLNSTSWGCSKFSKGHPGGFARFASVPLLEISATREMSTSRNLRLLIALVVILAICEMIAALEPGNPGYRGSPQRRRNRHLQEPLDLDELDPEDPSNEVEERPPMTPEMVEHASTPKLVKGLNFAGESTHSEQPLFPHVP